MKTTDAFTQGVSLIRTILDKMDGINEWRKRFIVEVILLFLTIQGRINFLQLGRYGRYNECTYRKGFEREFDFLTFNTLLIKETVGERRILGFDPTYIKKSGKHTPDVGYFYSGTDSRYKKGLEMSGLAVIDLDQQTSYHLEAIQTPSASGEVFQNGESIIDYYAKTIVRRATRLCQISRILVVDAYFTKRNFIDPITEQTPLEIVGRLRRDANLRYLYHGPQKGGRGRPKRYIGKINVKNLDHRRIRKEYEDDKIRIYAGVVNSVGLKRDIKLAYVEFLDSDAAIVKTKMFFSTELQMAGSDILEAYRARYQMEFNFRDGKQYAGLEHCQARSKNKIYFHVNASLTATSIAKCIQRHGVDRTVSMHYSISDIKTELFNRKLLKRIFSIYRIDRNIKINDNMIRSVLNYGKRAA